MNRRTYLKSALFLSGGMLVPAGVISLVGRQGTNQEANLAGFDGRIMGTSYSIRFGTSRNKQNNNNTRSGHLANIQEHSQSNTQQINLIAQRVHATLLEVDRHMSTWRDTSELTQFNNSLDNDWHRVSSDTLDVIDKSIQLSTLSEGAFDVSVGPLVDLWGFGADRNNQHWASGYQKPLVNEVKQRMKFVGFHEIEVDVPQSAIRKLEPKVRLDLSGIAKGFAVDKVAELMDAEGYENYLIELGGEIRSRGRKSNEQLWRVAVERPVNTNGEVLRVLNLQDSAIATSGDYRNFFVDGGQRYSHSIDPRNGYPVNHELVSVSVIAATTLQADALSTALIVMGPDEAQAFAEQNQLAVHFVLKSATGKLAEQFSSSFLAYLA